MTLINGKEVAAKLRSKIKFGVQELLEKGIQPCLAVILVGDDAASLTYVNAKAKACA